MNRGGAGPGQAYDEGRAGPGAKWGQTQDEDKEGPGQTQKLGQSGARSGSGPRAGPSARFPPRLGERARPRRAPHCSSIRPPRCDARVATVPKRPGRGEE